MDWMEYSLHETDVQSDATVSRRLEACLGSTNLTIIDGINDD